jgi:hypothetical protein
MSAEIKILKPAETAVAKERLRKYDYCQAMAQ